MPNPINANWRPIRTSLVGDHSIYQFLSYDAVRTWVATKCDGGLYLSPNNLVDYRLVRFFSTLQALGTKIDQFFEDGILKDLNPTYQV